MSVCHVCLRVLHTRRVHVFLNIIVFFFLAFIYKSQKGKCGEI